MGHVRFSPNLGTGGRCSLRQRRREARAVFACTLPCGAAALLGSYRFAFARQRNDRIDLVAIEGPLRVIDQRLGEGEHDSLVNRDEAAAIRPDSF
jgi:hypothetical protein